MYLAGVLTVIVCSHLVTSIFAGKHRYLNHKIRPAIRFLHGIFYIAFNALINRAKSRVPMGSVLTNATESAKKQIAEFEQVLAQIKVDAMGLGTRDLARLIKALKAI